MGMGVGVGEKSGVEVGGGVEGKKEASSEELAFG